MQTFLPKALLASVASVASVALFAASALSTQAAVVVTLPTPALPGSIVFTNAINFTVTSAGSVRSIIFDEWVTSDGSLTAFNSFPFTPNSVSYSINGGATQTTPITVLVDNAVTTVSITANDGNFVFNPFLVAIGNVVSIHAVTYILAAGSTPTGFNPQANQIFTGNAFLASNAGGAALTALTSVGVIPEPSRALLLMGGLGTLLFRRRKA